MNTATALAPAAPTAAPSSIPILRPSRSRRWSAQFLEYLKLERHFSDYTVKSYGADLVQFGQYLGGEIGRPHRPPPMPRSSRPSRSMRSRSNVSR